MAKKRALKVRITTNVVSWTNGQPLKYQAVASAAGINIYGDPKRTPDKALHALAAEANRFLVASQSIIAKLSDSGVLPP